ncbi:MAG: alpha/beta hydrolase [Sedimentisphaerales bacterium]|jgi:pimeloyl-ACP methyl ester carboxylesterase
MDSKKRKKSWRKSIYFTVIAFFAVSVIVGILAFVYRTYRQQVIRDDTKITEPTGIESLEKVTLDGVDQWILVRAEDRSNPVLLWLHGGPGSPTMPLASQHDRELVKHFVVVHWDQRGAGKSYSPDIPQSAMVVDQFVSDTYELTQMLAGRFDVPKIYLVGHSWGSQVGMLTVARHPDSYYAFIAVGQFVYSVAGDAVGYQFALNQAASEENEKALEELEAIGPPPWTTAKQRATNARWIDAFGGTGRQFVTADYFREIVNSPEYTLWDLFDYLRGMLFSGNALLANGEYNRVNLFEQAPKVDVPVHFFQGRYDYSTPGEVVERYYETLDAPQKSLVWFEQSAHFPQWEEPQKFADELLRILSETN